MDKFVKSKVHQDTVKEFTVVDESAAKRTVYTDDDIKAITLYAEKFTVARACTSMKKKPHRTQVSKWLKHYKATGEFFKTSKRGRERLMNKKVEAQLIAMVDDIRQKKGEEVHAGTVSAIARGLIRRTTPGLLTGHGGVNAYSETWARTLLARNNFKSYKPTTDRTIPLTQLAEHGEDFGYRLSQHADVTPRDTYNMDEWFALLNGGTRNFTYHRKSQAKSVAIRDTKLGITCSTTVSADGSVLFMQLIFKGQTKACLADVEEEDPRIFQQVSGTDSHFQNKETITAWPPSTSSTPRSVRNTTFALRRSRRRPHTSTSPMTSLSSATSKRWHRRRGQLTLNNASRR